MELFAKILLYTHIIAGALTLLIGPVALFYHFKNPRNHRAAGKAFFYAMLIVCFTAIVAYLRRPELVFYQFLLGISVLVLAGCMRAVRAIFIMKGAKAGVFDLVYSTVLLVCGVAMLSRGAWLLNHGEAYVFPILFFVFGFGALADSIENFRVFTRPERLGASEWMRMHSASMIGAFMASTTAFTVNAAHFLPWYLQWFGPTIMLLPVQIYFARKIKRLFALRQKAVA